STSGTAAVFARKHQSGEASATTAAELRRSASTYYRALMTSSALLDFCQGEHAWLLETIEALVRIESPSTDKAAVDRCGDELERRLRALGGEIQRIPVATHGDILRAQFGPPS